MFSSDQPEWNLEDNSFNFNLIKHFFATSVLSSIQVETNRDVTHWFVNFRFEAERFEFDQCHLGSLEPDVNIFG